MIDILIAVTPDQLRQIAEIVGESRISPLVMGENGIAAFYAEGPKILTQIGHALPNDQSDRLRAWDELSFDTQGSITAMAAGCLDWAMDDHLDEQYIQDWLYDATDLLDKILKPAPPTAS